MEECFSVVLVIVFASLDFGTKTFTGTKEKLAGNKFHGTKMYQIAFVLHAIAWYMQIHPSCVETYSSGLYGTIAYEFYLCLHFLRDSGQWDFAPELKRSSRCGKTASFGDVSDVYLFAFC